MKYLVLCLILLGISSCGNKFVRDNPREQYRQCMKENADNTEKCDIYRDTYQKRIDSHSEAYQKGSGSESY